MEELDLIDRKIVAALMQDATLPIAQIADRVGLSQTPCWKRIQKLESAGVLMRRVAWPIRYGLALGLRFLSASKRPITPPSGARRLVRRCSPFRRSWRSIAWRARWITSCGWPPAT